MGKDKKIKISETRTKEERIQESRIIIAKLNDLKLTVQYAAIKIFFIKLKEYIYDGNRIIIDIPFPDFGRRIVGILANNKHENVWIKLESDDTLDFP